VRAGVQFNDGIMQERQDQDVRKEAASSLSIHNT